MDALSHTLIGVGVGNAFFRRRYGPEAITVLAWASNLPDVDGLPLAGGAPIAFLLQRSFGHSLALLPAWCLALALFFRRRYPERDLDGLFGLCLLGTGLHVLGDLADSFGATLLWPFSVWRPSWDVLFGVDLVLVALLAAPYALALRASLKPYLEGLCRLSLCACLAYVGLCASLHQRAEAALAAAAAESGSSVVAVLPEAFGPHRWRGVLRKGNVYRVGLFHSLGGRMDFRPAVATAEEDPAVRRAEELPIARRLLAVYRAPVWTARPEPGGGTIVGLYDLKSKSLLLDPDRRLMEFRFEAAADGSVDVLGWRRRPRGPIR